MHRGGYLKIAILTECEVDLQEPESDADTANVDVKRECADDANGQNFHRMFDAFFSGKHPFFCPEGRAWNPPTDILETENALDIKIEVAGLREQDVEVKVNQEYLIIRGERADHNRKPESRYHLMEIHYGSFERVIRLPHAVEVKNITATLQNGFLFVRVPKDSNIAEYRIEIE